MAASDPQLLAEMIWPMIQAIVEDGETLCVLPVGATEQHGRHLPTGTDTIIAEALCHAASARTGVPVLPTLSVGSSDAHTNAWPGTFSLGPRLLMDVLLALAPWVRDCGFNRLLIVNAHVGNVAPLAVAADELRSAGALVSALFTGLSSMTKSLAELQSTRETGTRMPPRPHSCSASAQTSFTAKRSPTTLIAPRVWS